MKSLFVMALALVSANAMASSAGEATLTLYPDYGSVTEVDVIDTGAGLEAVNQVGTLAKVGNGYQGFYFGSNYWDYTVSSTGLTGSGSKGSVQLTQTLVNGGYKLDGMVNFQPVTLVVTSSKISVTTGFTNGISYDLTAQANGTYSGEGSITNGVAINTLDQVTFSATGTLANAIQDPATALALLVLPFLN